MALLVVYIFRSLHRGLFTNCWVQFKESIPTLPVVMDSLDIWGVQGVSSQIENVRGAGIQVNGATSFAIMNSTFSEWDLDGNGISAVLIHPNRSTNFSIIGNQFIRDADFGNQRNSFTITVMPGQYNRYIISNNMSWSDQPNLGVGVLRAVIDDGTAVRGKIVIPGHNL